jgi:predicted NUDIX family NTP pyrophosphohydrolase
VPPKLSAGLLLFRQAVSIEVLLVHPGGPFWAGKDNGAWSIPKGEYESAEDALAAARREFAEELGAPPPSGSLIELGSIKLSSGKVVTGWAVEGDFDPTTAVSNTFELIWPPKSGQVQTYPEVDRVDWFTVDIARRKLNRAQEPFLDRLLAALALAC